MSDPESRAKGRRKPGVLTLLFALYTFIYMVTLTYIDKSSVAIVTEKWQILLHFIDLGTVTLVFLLFALAGRVHLPANAQNILCVISCVFMPSMFC